MQPSETDIAANFDRIKSLIARAEKRAAARTGNSAPSQERTQKLSPEEPQTQGLQWQEPQRAPGPDQAREQEQEPKPKQGMQLATRTQLVAVTKTQPPEIIDAALKLGHRLFGENRVQESLSHWQEIRESGLYSDLKLHLIGPLQTNKAAQAVAHFDLIETLDREKLAKTLGAEMQKQGRALPCFIQVNTGEEPQKGGIAPQALFDFHHFCKTECGLNITGLMCIPPAEDPPALHFALLRHSAQKLSLPHLSMGMSADFEKAIALGATHIRIGSALFGPRD